jgi:hypothetical protein
MTDYIDVLLLRTEILRASTRYEDAIKDCNYILSLDPKNTIASIIKHLAQQQDSQTKVDMTKHIPKMMYPPIFIKKKKYTSIPFFSAQHFMKHIEISSRRKWLTY